MIDRVAAKLGRKLYEVPVGFKWFVDGLLDGSLGFGGEESAGASFLRRDGSVWTTDKDGIIPALLAAEITARMGRDPGEDLPRAHARVRRAGLRPHRCAGHSGAEGDAGETLAAAGPSHGSGRREDPGHSHPRAGQRRSHRRREGDRRERMVRGASVRHRGYLQDLRRELPRSGSSAPHPGGSADHRRRGAGGVSELESAEAKRNHEQRKTRQRIRP